MPSPETNNSGPHLTSSRTVRVGDVPHLYKTVVRFRRPRGMFCTCIRRHDDDVASHPHCRFCRSIPGNPPLPTWSAVDGTTIQWSHGKVNGPTSRDGWQQTNFRFFHRLCERRQGGTLFFLFAMDKYSDKYGPDGKFHVTVKLDSKRVFPFHIDGLVPFVVGFFSFSKVERVCSRAPCPSTQRQLHQMT